MYLLIRFFAGGPLRFLFVPLGAMLLIGGGSARAAAHGRTFAAPELVFLGAALLLNLAFFLWYLRLVVRGEARRFWADVLDFLDRAGRERQ